MRKNELPVILAGTPKEFTAWGPTTAMNQHPLDQTTLKQKRLALFSQPWNFAGSPMLTERQPTPSELPSDIKMIRGFLHFQGRGKKISVADKPKTSEAK